MSSTPTGHLGGWRVGLLRSPCALCTGTAQSNTGLAVPRPSSAQSTGAHEKQKELKPNTGTAAVLSIALLRWTAAANVHAASGAPCGPWVPFPFASATHLCSVAIAAPRNNVEVAFWAWLCASWRLLNVFLKRKHNIRFMRGTQFACGGGSTGAEQCLQ